MGVGVLSQLGEHALEVQPDQQGEGRVGRLRFQGTQHLGLREGAAASARIAEGDGQVQRGTGVQRQ